MKKLQMVVNGLEKKAKINKEIYGHFVEQAGNVVYKGLFVGKNSEIPNINGVRKDIIDAFREINIPLLHWPGGGVADSYHWKRGIGPEDQRPTSINRWTLQVEENTFGTHEFFDLCELLECEPYLVLNVGSSTVEEVQSWIEYITFDGDTEMTRLRKENGRDKPWKLKYICMGNEWWFFESARAYAEDYHRYNMFARDYGDNKLVRILRGPQHYAFKETDELADYTDPGSFDAMTLYQIIPSEPNGDRLCMFTGQAFEMFSDDGFHFDEQGYYTTLQNALKMDERMSRHLGILKRKDGNQNVKLVIDEWGTWYKQSDPNEIWSMPITMRDAIIAGTVLNLYNNRANDLLLCTVAMSVNGLCHLFETKDEKFLKTPVFHIFKMYRQHQDATLVHSFIEKETFTVNGCELPCISYSASVKDGNMLITLVNAMLDREYELSVNVLNHEFSACEGTILQEEIHALNTFDNPDKVTEKKFTDFEIADGSLTVRLPKASVVSLLLKP